MDEVTRRDLFAMAALQGLLSGPTMIRAEKLAGYARQLGDAMMNELDKVTPDPLPWPKEPENERSSSKIDGLSLQEEVDQLAKRQRQISETGALPFSYFQGPGRPGM